MCYPGSRLDVNNAHFEVEEINAQIITSWKIPSSQLPEDIYGGDDQIFEHRDNGLIIVSS